MAKRKKIEPASEAEALVDSNVPKTPVEEPTPTVSMDAPPSKDISHGDSQSTDERDRRTTYPDPNVPFSIAHNNQAGVQLLKSERFKQVQLAFRSPITGEIEGKLAAAGWKYRPEERVYTKQYGDSGAGVSMFEAKRFYDELVEKLLDEKGISRSHTR